MNQERLDELEGRIKTVEGNGWHDKYILEKLEMLTKAVKEVKVETCRSLDKLKDDNASAHKTLHDKLDAQKTMCANRPIECQKAFLPNRTFHWLLIVLIVLFGTSFSLSGTALKQNADHKTAVVEWRKNHEIECAEIKEVVEKYVKHLEEESHTD
jgi:gas vesicle protein